MTQKKNMKQVNATRNEAVNKARELVEHCAHLEQVMTAFQPLLRRVEDLSGYAPGEEVNVYEMIERFCHWADEAIKAHPDLLAPEVHERRKQEATARLEVELPHIEAFKKEMAEKEGATLQ